MEATTTLTEAEQRWLLIEITRPTAKAVWADLPAEVQTLLKLALAKNSTKEIQVEAAKTVINVTSIATLRVVALRLIVAAQSVLNGEGA